MDAIPTTLRALPADRRGATAVEYGLIAALIVMAILGGVGALGASTLALWTDVSNAL